MPVFSKHLSSWILSSNHQKLFNGHLMTIMITFEITPLERSRERMLSIGFQRRGIDQVCRDDSEGKRVKKVCEFVDERYVKNRSITDVDWSPKVSHYLFSLQSDSDDLLVSGTECCILQ